MRFAMSDAVKPNCCKTAACLDVADAPAVIAIIILFIPVADISAVTPGMDAASAATSPADRPAV